MSDEVPMSISPAPTHGARAGRTVPYGILRQIGLMGLVALFTIVAISATLEVGARVIFPSHEGNRCALPGGRFARNCTSQPAKLWEGPWYTEAYNECGFRTAESCLQTPPGLRRVAVIGSSLAHGLGVPYAQTFAGRATAELKSDCHGPVDFQNLSLPAAFVGPVPVWHQILNRMPQALALHPSAIITVLSSNDLATYEAPPSLSTAVLAPATPKTGGKGLSAWLRQFKYVVATQSVAILAIRGATFHDMDLYLTRYLQTGRGDFLSPQLDGKWRMRVKIADSVLGPMEEQAKAAGVLFVAFFFPTYPQAIAASEAKTRAELAPYALQQALRGVVVAHGGLFFDLTPILASQPDLASDYYVSIDHPNARGHQILATQVVKDLISNVPAFSSCKRLSR